LIRATSKEVLIMPKPSSPDTKLQALRQQGTENPHPERVADTLFQQEEFFDPRDLVQVKYEMIRRVRTEGTSVSDAAASFGFSRPAFYQARNRLDREGLAGLLPQQRGPKQAHKLSEEVKALINQAVSEDSSLRSPALAELVKERFGISVHPRTIEKALAARQKKLRRY
jgi:transposase